MAAFGMTRVEVDVLLRTLFGAGYLVVDLARSQILCWIRTPAGAAFAEVPLGRPLSRARADRLLQRVLRRVAEINRSDNPLLQGQRIRLVFLEQPGTPAPDSCDTDTPG